ncbi:alpha/beta hydrolase [Streptomyces amakusaensis]
MRSRRLVPLIAVSLLATLTPGLASAATAAPAAPAPPAAPAVAPPAQYTGQTPDWKRCHTALPADFQCATIKVPLDYAKPGGKKIDIAISRFKAANPAERHGVLLSNPGGPGGPGLGLPAELDAMLPAAVRERYDLIGFDPRGTGRSTPVVCGLTPDERPWPRPHKAKTFAKDVQWAKSVADKCRARHGDILPHITTRNTARDMDVIRAVLGEKKISYLGYSYGTYLGSVYTQMFPKRADRFVLDSATDPGKAWREMVRDWGPEAESAFKRWTEWTAERSATYRLGDTPAKVSRSFWDLVAHADREPIVYGGIAFDGALLRGAMRPAVFDARHAAESVVIFKDLVDGKPVPQPPAAEPVPDAIISSQWSVLCGDTTWPRNPFTYREDSRRDAARHPLVGDHVSNITPCAFWDRAVEPKTKVDNKVGALIVQSEWDSQTPLSAALGMHRAMKGSKMVTVKGGEGHAVYLLNRSACADRAVDAYLATGELPAGNVTCAPNPREGKGKSAAVLPVLPRSPLLPVTIG